MEQHYELLGKAAVTTTGVVPRLVEKDFAVRHQLDAPHLVDLFSWSEEEFLTRTEGSAIRRIGHECWLRNIAVALGNAPTSDEIVRALKSRLGHASAMVREHVEWALAQHAGIDAATISETATP